MSEGCCPGGRDKINNRASQPLRLSVRNEKDSNKTLKNEGKIRLYFYGDNLDNLLSKIINQTSVQEKTIKEGNIIYKEGNNNALNWNYFIFDKINEESNTLISKKKYKKILKREIFMTLLLLKLMNY